MFLSDLPRTESDEVEQVITQDAENLERIDHGRDHRQS
jgi:hypothetical protein